MNKPTMKMNANDCIQMLGKTSDDPAVNAFLASVGFTKPLKIPRDDFHAYVSIKKLGLEITFIDEAHLREKARNYDEGSLVLINIRFYSGRRSAFKPFRGELPHGLQFDFGLKECVKKLGKPAWEGEEVSNVLWDIKGHSVYVSFDNDYKIIYTISLQLAKLYS
jgi:hypothetical protein